jgi:hypothetical protein
MGWNGAWRSGEGQLREERLPSVPFTVLLLLRFSVLSTSLQVIHLVIGNGWELAGLATGRLGVGNGWVGWDRYL